MKSNKSFMLLSIPFMLAFGIYHVHSTDDDDTTAQLSETTQGYDDLKCVSRYEYNLLIDSFIKQTAKEIQLNHSSTAMETLNKISPEDDRFVKDIVRETLKQSDLKLLHLLEFLNQTKFSTTKLDGLLDIFVHSNNSKEKSDRFNYYSGPSVQTVLKWLDLEIFTRYFVNEHGNNTEVSLEADRLLSDVTVKAKNIILQKPLRHLLRFDDFNKVKFGSEHIFSIIKTYYNNGTTIENIIREVEQTYPNNAICWAIAGLYNLIESTLGESGIYQLLPLLKYASSCRKNVKLRDGSIFQNILSESYFHLKNAYNNQYLYVKQSKRVASNGKKSPFIITTVSDTDSEKVNWKFGSYEEFRSDHIVLTIKNENFERNKLRALPCLMHEDEFVVQMENSKYYNGDIINDAWSIEVDDAAGERFRIKNDLSKSYLAVSMDNNQSKVILVNELNAENYDSVHWTLEIIDS